MSTHFFGIGVSGLDPEYAKKKMSSLLAAENLKLGAEQLDALFCGLALKSHEATASVVVPFPLIASMNGAKNHAKKLHGLIKGQGASLGLSQTIIARFYGFKQWKGLAVAFGEHKEKVSRQATVVAVADDPHNDPFPLFVRQVLYFLDCTWELLKAYEVAGTEKPAAQLACFDTWYQGMPNAFVNEGFFRIIDRSMEIAHKKLFRESQQLLRNNFGYGPNGLSAASKSLLRALSQELILDCQNPKWRVLALVSLATLLDHLAQAFLGAVSCKPNAAFLVFGAQSSLKRGAGADLAEKLCRLNEDVYDGEELENRIGGLCLPMLAELCANFGEARFFAPWQLDVDSWITQPEAATSLQGCADR